MEEAEAEVMVEVEVLEEEIVRFAHIVEEMGILLTLGIDYITRFSSIVNMAIGNSDASCNEASSAKKKTQKQ